MLSLYPTSNRSYKIPASNKGSRPVEEELMYFGTKTAKTKAECDISNLMQANKRNNEGERRKARFRAEKAQSKKQQKILPTNFNHYYCAKNQ